MVKKEVVKVIIKDYVNAIRVELKKEELKKKEEKE